MPDAKLRRAIAVEAARLMYERSESEYYTAKRKAADRICRGQVKPSDLPKNAEIRELVQMHARMYEGDKRTLRLKEMRFAALAMMKLLIRFKPRLIGSVFTGHIRQGSDIDLHLFSDSTEAIETVLQSENLTYEVERKQITKHNETRVFTHIHLKDDFEYELTVYAGDLVHYVFKSSITGKAIERASIAELEQFLAKEYADEVELIDDAEIDDNNMSADLDVDRFHLYRLLLQPLGKVKQSPKYHPEGDALYHSLQVFEQAKNLRPWDEEFLTAALLHDIGKAIDPKDHVAAGLEALDGLITERTHWLIEHHMQALEYKAGTLGFKASKHLEKHEYFQDVMDLRDCDDRGRSRGAVVGSVEEALAFIEQLEASCDE